MARPPIDPARLEGEALKRWYARSAWDIDRERREAEAQQREDYAAETRRGLEASQRADSFTPTVATGEDVLWVINGRGEWRPARTAPSEFQNTTDFSQGSPYPARPPIYSAGMEGGKVIPVGNPANPKHRRGWMRREGRDWPKVPESGRNYDVHHTVPRANGGTDTLDNIEPIHPDEHRAHHKREGHFKEWGGRSGGGRGRGGVGAIGAFSLVPAITGLLSGRIRTDSFDNFTSDMMGVPSQNDLRKREEERRGQLFPNSRPGERLV